MKSAIAAWIAFVVAFFAVFFGASLTPGIHLSEFSQALSQSPLGPVLLLIAIVNIALFVAVGCAATLDEKYSLDLRVVALIALFVFDVVSALLCAGSFALFFGTTRLIALIGLPGMHRASILFWFWFICPAVSTFIAVFAGGIIQTLEDKRGNKKTVPC